MLNSRSDNRNSTPSQPSQNDDNVFQFTKLTSPCNLCFQRISQEQDPPLHWLACSHRQRQHLKTTPTVYQHAQNLAESEFDKLKGLHDPAEVNTEAHKILWMLQGIEALGESDYRGLLESLCQTDGYTDTEMKRAIVDTMMGVMLRNGSVLSTVIAIEDALNYNGLDGRLHFSDRTTNVNLLPNWKIYEVEFLESRAATRFATVYREFSNLPRVTRDSLPGRGPLAVVVWMFKLKKVGNAI